MKGAMTDQGAVLQRGKREERYGVQEEAVRRKKKVVKKGKQEQVRVAIVVTGAGVGVGRGAGAEAERGEGVTVGVGARGAS